MLLPASLKSVTVLPSERYLIRPFEKAVLSWSSYEMEKLDEKFGQCGYSFMQDGATCHTSEKAMEWLRPKMKIVEGWPANSPDLNPIEMLWAVMKGQLKTRNPVDVAQLESFVEEIWDGIDQQVIDHLVSDFKRRLRLVVDMKGEKREVSFPLW